jgi:hypothetical protein
MQDNAILQTAIIILDFLHGTFSPRVISDFYPEHICGRNWSTRNPDSNRHNYFLWGFMREKFSKNLASLMKLRAMVVQLCPDYREHMQVHDHKYTYMFVIQKLYSRTATILNTPPLNINLHALVVK